MPRPRTFTALDFETAHPGPNSICQVGLVRFVDGIEVEAVSMLVQPPGNFYWTKFIAIHGIRPADTEVAPTFGEIWPKIRPFLENEHVVAHNGFRFDFPVLAATLMHHGLPVPYYTAHDTYRIHRQGLAACCDLHRIELNHHEAVSDARACGRLFLIPGPKK